MSISDLCSVVDLRRGERPTTCPPDPPARAHGHVAGREVAVPGGVPRTRAGRGEHCQGALGRDAAARAEGAPVAPCSVVRGRRPFVPARASTRHGGRSWASRPRGSGRRAPFLSGCHSRALSGNATARLRVFVALRPEQNGQPAPPSVRFPMATAHRWSGAAEHRHLSPSRSVRWSRARAGRSSGRAARRARGRGARVHRTAGETAADLGRGRGRACRSRAHHEALRTSPGWAARARQAAQLGSPITSSTDAARMARSCHRSSQTRSCGGFERHARPVEGLVGLRFTMTQRWAARLRTAGPALCGGTPHEVDMGESPGASSPPPSGARSR
jgi:hypothetical protein